jgi:hypothetical protein
MAGAAEGSTTCSREFGKLGGDVEIMSDRIFFFKVLYGWNACHFEILTASPEIFICNSLFVENASIAWTPGHFK